MILPQDHQLITVIDKPFLANDAIKAIANNNIQDEPFYVMDVGDLFRKHENWVAKLPNVKPFYAVKCNDSPIVLRVFASLGIGFDCASKGEIDKVLEIEGVGAERIIFANPTKISSHIKHSARVGVDLMTFDNTSELHKIKAYHPDAKLVLRIRCDAAQAQCSLGVKFGCDEELCGGVLEAAASLNLSVVGVSFHVGSGCHEPGVFRRAIRMARRVFDVAEAHGITMSLLDIGGGFLGNTLNDIDQMADIINDSLAEEFGDLKDIEVIAEPGRYYVASAYTLATSIHSKREVEGKPAMYYLNDGVYGSFNCILYEHAVPVPESLDKTAKGQLKSCSLWGPTCDSLDLISEDALLPSLDIGDILVFANMGAYTLPVASSFNGYPLPKVHHFIPAKYRKMLKGTISSDSQDSNTSITCQLAKNIPNIYDLLPEIAN